MKKQIILTVHKLSNQNNGLRLGISKEDFEDANQFPLTSLKIELDKKIISMDNSLKTYFNQKALVNSEIDSWLKKNKLYPKNKKPFKLIFTQSIKNGTHKYVLYDNQFNNQ